MEQQTKQEKEKERKRKSLAVMFCMATQQKQQQQKCVSLNTKLITFNAQMVIFQCYVSLLFLS